MDIKKNYIYNKSISFNLFPSQDTKQSSKNTYLIVEKKKSYSSLPHDHLQSTTEDLWSR